MTTKEALRHAGDLERLPQDIVDGVAAFMPKRLWIIDNFTEEVQWPGDDERRVRRLIHCEACGGEEVEEQKGGRYPICYPQNVKGLCPFCGTEVTAKHATKGIKTIFDRLDAVFYRKSAVNPRAVVALAAHCTRDYREADDRAPWEQDPWISVRGIAVFDADARDSLRIQTRLVYTGQSGECWGVTWKPVKSMNRIGFGDDGLFMWQTPPRAVLTDTLRTAIRDTPFERAWHDAYLDRAGGIRALDMIARRPCVEYMTKLGMEDLVIAALDDALPPRLVNWKGRDMAGVLRLSRERLGQLKGKGIRLTPELCAVLQFVDRRGIRCGIETAEGVAWVCREEGKNVKKALANALECFPEERRAKALKYMARNRERRLGDMDDLWDMTLELGGNLLNDEDAFPKDFRAAHDRLASRMRATKDARQDGKIQRRYKKLDERFGFTFGGLILRPAASAAEVVREGQVLHHCVGSYVQRYAEGGTVICVLRRAVEPDAPWRTVEISAATGQVVQDRGWHNDWGENDLRDDAYRAALSLFWEAWGERNKIRRRKSA